MKAVIPWSISAVLFVIIVFLLSLPLETQKPIDTRLAEMNKATHQFVRVLTKCSADSDCEVVSFDGEIEAINKNFVEAFKASRKLRELTKQSHKTDWAQANQFEGKCFYPTNTKSENAAGSCILEGPPPPPRAEK